MKRTMMRLVSTAALVALIVFAASCGGGGGGQQDGGGQQGTLKLGVSFDVLNEIRQAEIAAIRAAAKERGDTVEFVVANDDPQQQASQIQNLISAEQVDAVIAIAQNKDQIVSSIRRANQAGVPFIAIDRAPAEGGEVALQVTGDPVADGKLAGRAMAGTGKELKVLHLLGALTDVNAIGRRDGFKQAVEGSNDVEIVQEAPTEWDPQRALDATSNALQKNPEINAIFVPSDYLLPSVLSALKSADREAKPGDGMTIVTIDGAPSGCKALRQGQIETDIATLIDEFAARAVEGAHKAAGGQEIADPVVKVPGLVLNQENLEQKSDQVWGCEALE